MEKERKGQIGTVGIFGALAAALLGGKKSNKSAPKVPAKRPVGMKVDLNGPDWAPLAREKPATKQPTVKELKAKAKRAGVTGYSRMNKPALIQAVTKATRRTPALALPFVATVAGIATLVGGGTRAQAAKAGANVLTYGGKSAYDNAKAQGKSEKDAKAIATRTAADNYTFNVAGTYQRSRAKGRSVLAAGFEAALAVPSMGIGYMAGSNTNASVYKVRPIKKTPTMTSSRGRLTKQGRAKFATESSMRPISKPPMKTASASKPDGMVAAHIRRVGGKSIRIDSYRQTQKQLNRAR